MGLTMRGLTEDQMEIDDGPPGVRIFTGAGFDDASWHFLIGRKRYKKKKQVLNSREDKFLSKPFKCLMKQNKSLRHLKLCFILLLKVLQ